MIDQAQARQILLEVVPPGGFVDLFCERRSYLELRLEDGRMAQICSGVDSGAGVRLIESGRVRYTYTTDLTLKGLQAAAKAVREVKHSADTDPLREASGEQSLRERASEAEGEGLAEIVGALKSADATVRQMSDSIRQVTLLFVEEDQEIAVVNTEDVFVEDRRLRARLVAMVTVARGSLLQSAHETCSFAQEHLPLKDSVAEEVAKRAACRALLLLDAADAPCGEMPVVIAGDAGGYLIHEACGHGLEADFVRKGSSVYAGRLGKMVASPQVTVIDDSGLSDRYGSYRYDDEGVPSQRTTLIECGRLVEYVSDRLSAAQLGRHSTGNGRRQSFRFPPMPRLSNTYIAAGEWSADEIIASVSKGILVKHLGGGQVDIATGDFVFSVTEGYLITGGRVKEPLRNLTITGNGPRVLECIDRVGNDIGFTSGICGKWQLVPVSAGQPTIHVPSLVVGGRQ